MASLLGAGRSMLARVRAAEMENGSYVSSTGTVPVTALQAETKFESDTGDIIIDSRAIDWIVPASQLLAFPVQGDEIIVDGRTYQTVAIGMEPVARWHDRDGSTLRIHTVLTGDILASVDVAAYTADSTLVTADRIAR